MKFRIRQRPSAFDRLRPFYEAQVLRFWMIWLYIGGGYETGDAEKAIRAYRININKPSVKRKTIAYISGNISRKPDNA